MSAPSTEVITDPADLAVDRAAWDALAVGASRPYGAPGWALPWWSAVRPVGCEFRAVAVRDGPELTGLAAFHVSRDRLGITTWGLLGAGASSHLEPLARPGALRSVATAIARALGESGVDMLSLAAVPRNSPWPALLRDAWPARRPRLSLVTSLRAPYVDVPDGGYEAWLASRSQGFRRQTRRLRRELGRCGGGFRRAITPAEVTSGLADLERLHRRQWDRRGGSRALTDPVAVMLRQVAAQLPPTRFQVWTAAADGGTIAAALFLAAGGEMHAWISGFDPAWARWSPSLILNDEIVRYAAEAGYRRVGLGPGPAPYKDRLATGEELLDWVDLLPRGGRYPYVRACQSPYRLYRVASNRTPPEVKQRIRSSVGRVLGSETG
jgi:CelD/BcsL family acetyltransferase involved in cellulose biosynthesis